MEKYEINPEWIITQGELLNNPSITFKTIEETLARIRYIKNIGLENLRKKAVLIENPQATIYDIVKAIEDISINSGIPLQLPYKIIDANIKIEDSVPWGDMVTEWRKVTVSDLAEKLRNFYDGDMVTEWRKVTMSDLVKKLQNFYDGGMVTSTNSFKISSIKNFSLKTEKDIVVSISHIKTNYIKNCSLKIKKDMESFISKDHIEKYLFENPKVRTSFSITVSSDGNFNN
jgi:hypothetical protein